MLSMMPHLAHSSRTSSLNSSRSASAVSSRAGTMLSSSRQRRTSVCTGTPSGVGGNMVLGATSQVLGARPLSPLLAPMPRRVKVLLPGWSAPPCMAVCAAVMAVMAGSCALMAFTTGAIITSGARPPTVADPSAATPGSTQPLGRPTFMARPHSSTPSRCCAASASSMVRISQNPNLPSCAMLTWITGRPSGDRLCSALLNTSATMCSVTRFMARLPTYTSRCRLLAWFTLVLAPCACCCATHCCASASCDCMACMAAFCRAISSLLPPPPYAPPPPPSLLLRLASLDDFLDFLLDFLL
mmetsp:Transcript_27064/g.66377  ORF Transcript_27064/g.66377 Transcript_27064/m.66377 type:complete len:299 (+) Transcript_27064:1754-2650(+)